MLFHITCGLPRLPECGVRLCVMITSIIFFLGIGHTADVTKCLWTKCTQFLAHLRYLCQPVIITNQTPITPLASFKYALDNLCRASVRMEISRRYIPEEMLAKIGYVWCLTHVVFCFTSFTFMVRCRSRNWLCVIRY